MASVHIDHVSKSYQRGVAPANDDISLAVTDGEILVLFGPSGCGKTTLLRLIAGLERVSSGRITLGERVVDGGPFVEPGDRDVAMVFQSAALYPHMSVFDNMAFGLKMRRVPVPDIGRRINDVAARFELEELLQRRPQALSDGQRQRVALARALVREPQLFLLDEPLSMLDARRRAAFRAELKQLQRRLGVTMITVTHDQNEAMALGDRIAVLEQGRLQQLGTPLEIYNRPANRSVAAALGAPPMNFLGGRLVQGLVIKLNRQQSFLLPDRFQAAASDGLDVELGIRPEHLIVKKANHGVLKATVELVEQLGEHADVHVRLNGGEDTPLIIARAERDAPAPDIGELVGLVSRMDAVHVFERATGAALAASERSRDDSTNPS